MADPSAREHGFWSNPRLAEWRASARIGYGFGLIAFALALAIRWQLSEMLPAGFPFLTFFPAIILTTFVGGLWPGLFTALLSTLAAWYFFIPPFHSFALSAEGALAVGFFVATAVINVVIIHLMQSAFDRASAERARSVQMAAQREVLFTELQHRVSNNLQVISALLALQKSTLADEQARQALGEASQRLMLIAKLNRKLHDPATIGLDLKDFLRELCQDVSKAAGIEDAGCNVKGAEGVSLRPEKAVPLALIVAELLSNSIEHGFAGREPGHLRMNLERADDHVVLTVQDNGNGLPAGFDLKQARSLGLRIVKSLAQQIGAQLEIFSDKGTVCRLTFAP
jgi:two-component sensor histidine kinase